MVIENQVLRLNVSMENAVLVKVLETQDHAGNEKFCLLLVKLAIFADVEAEIASIHQVNHQVKIVSVLKCVLHIN